MDKETAHRVHLARWRRFVTAFLVISIVSAAVGLYTSPVAARAEAGGGRGNCGECGRGRLTGPPRWRQHDAARLRFSGGARGDDTDGQVGAARARWPQTVRVVITERAPWAFWQVGEDRYVIDTEGVVLPGSVPLENAPVIRDLAARCDWRRETGSTATPLSCRGRCWSGCRRSSR